MDIEMQLQGMFRPTVLVVDDSETVRNLICRILADDGYHTEGVETGREALEWLDVVTPTLILLDYRLPDINGMQVVEEMKAAGKDIPFVIITGHGDEKVAVEMMKLGAADYLVKDEVFIELLPSVVRQVLQASRNERLLKETEEELLVKETRFVELFNHIHSAVAVFEAVDEGRDFVLLDVNPALEKLEGVRREKLLGRRLTESFPRVQRMAHYEVLGRVWRTGKGESHWGELYSDAEEQRWLDHHTYRLPTGELVVVYEDISDRKRFEGLLLSLTRGVSPKTGEEFFRSLVAHLGELLQADYAFVAEFVPGRHDRVRTVAVCERGENSRNFEYDLKGTPCKQVMEEGVCSYPSQIQRLFPGDRSLADFGIEGYVGSRLTDSNGRPLGLLVVLFRDRLQQAAMTELLLQVFAIRAAAELERQRSERELRESERRFRKLYQEFETILKGIPDQLSLLTPELEVIWSNRPEQSSAQQPDRSRGKRHCFESARESAPPCQSCHARRCFKAGLVQEALIESDDRIFGVKFFPLKTDRDEVHSVICMASDVTEKTRLREEADRASRLASLGEIAAGVAHEINNPNALILMNASVLGDVLAAVAPILERQYRDCGDFSVGKMPYSRMREEIPKLHQEIGDSARRIRRIVEELREFVGTSDQAERQIVSLNQVASRSVRMVAQIHSNYRIDLSLGDDGKTQGNQQQLEQVVINLLLNAVQSLPSSDRKVQVTTGMDQGAGQGVITVQDEGAGMLPETLARITDPFYTTKREQGGTGLGLSVAVRIVKDHGGSLHFDSTPCTGTEVIVRLPLESAEGS